MQHYFLIPPKRLFIYFYFFKQLFIDANEVVNVDLTACGRFFYVGEHVRATHL